MTSISNILLTNSDKAPEVDIATCSSCGWSGPVAECETDQEGDWESGYYEIHLCPKCEDGGCVDDYNMSPERAKEWNEWNKQREAKLKSIQILEANDTVLPTDWCRPLSLCTMSGGMSDSMSFKSCYSGTPENNVKWVLFKHQFGECWGGKKVFEITNAMGMQYEFVRGDVPKSHRLDMSDYNTKIRG